MERTIYLNVYNDGSVNCFDSKKSAEATLTNNLKAIAIPVTFKIPKKVTVTKWLNYNPTASSISEVFSYDSYESAVKGAGATALVIGQPITFTYEK